MNVQRSHPCLAGGDGSIAGAATQLFRSRRQERGVCLLQIPVEVAFVRTLHREGVALLALTQRSLTKLDSPDLVQQRGNRDGTEQRENQSARGAVVRDVAPALECDAFFA